ncbi:restriction endonuclease subunit S [Aquabacterium sp.]|uniref:restriction endonuclease subunit S n=1 Tax=Aquabacterium sp. TaxID=1872578 RepID=UPI003BB0C0CC
MNAPGCITRIKYVAAIKGGAGFPHEEQDLQDEELPFYKVASLEQADARGVLSSADHTISRATATKLGAHVFMPETVVFAKVGAALLLNRFRQLDTASCIDNNMMGLESFRGVAYPRYVLYAMSAKDLSLVVNPGAVPSVNGGQVADERIWLPPFSEQVRIANFLDQQTARIDALIAEKERLISKLDELRWARVADELLNKPHASSKPLRLKHLVTSCQNGLWGDEPIEDGPNIVVVRVADFDKKNRCVALEKPTFRHIAPDKLHTRLLRKGDLLIEKSGGGPTTPVGNVVMFDAEVPAICSNFVARMPVTEGNDPAFVCLLFQALYAVGRNVPHIKQTSGIQNLDATSYLSQTVPVPPLKEQQELAKRVLCTFEAMESLGHASVALVERLREYRSSLISAAVTGQLDISSLRESA